MSKYRVRVDPQTGRHAVARLPESSPRRGRGAWAGRGAAGGAGARGSGGGGGGGGGGFAAAIRRLPEDRRERLALLAAVAGVLRFGAGAFVERMRVIGLGGFFGLAFGIPLLTLIGRAVLERRSPRVLLQFGSDAHAALAILAAGALVGVLLRAWWRRA